MPTIAWNDWAAWWATVTPEFLALLALPVVVVAAGLLRGWLDGRHAGGRQRDSA